MPLAYDRGAVRCDWQGVLSEGRLALGHPYPLSTPLQAGQILCQHLASIVKSAPLRSTLQDTPGSPVAAHLARQIPV